MDCNLVHTSVSKLLVLSALCPQRYLELWRHSLCFSGSTNAARFEFILALCEKTLAETSHFMNSSKLSEQEQRGLCDLLHYAFLELRNSGSPEYAFQVSRLAYALHNLPHLLFADNFAWEKVEGPLRYYQSQFYQDEERVASTISR